VFLIIVDRTGQRRDYVAMRKNASDAKDQKKTKPFETIKIGNVSVPIYRNRNIIPKRDEAGKIIYGPPDAEGKRQALIRYESHIYTLAFYQGSKRVRRKFSDLEKARREAEIVAINIGKGELEALKLKGHDRADYVRAMQKLREWKPDADLNLAVTDYVAAVKRLPEDASLKEAVDFYIKRHPIGLPPKTVREVVDELIDSKTKSGKSDVYVKDLRLRLGQFADAFNIRISLITGKQVEDFLRAPRPSRGKGKPGHFLSGRTQNNFRKLINTLVKFAIKRGYLPKDHDEMSGVDLAEEENGDIEIFTPVELRKLLAACLAPTKERGKMRDRESMVPYLAVAAFCGLRSAEIARLDWSEVHLTGAERFIEVKAAKAKTASRRTVPISDNCAAWLAPFAKESGPVCHFERPDKQCFFYVGPAAKVEWKRNGLRHSFISYRLAQIKNVHQVSLEAGNSPQMVFAHYRQLVTETLAAEWFGIVPPTDWKNILPMPAEVIANQKVETAISANA
jgi:integrase